MDRSINQFQNFSYMRKKIDQIIMRLRENKPVLEEKYKVKTLRVFGYHVRGEQTKSSYLDIWELKKLMNNQNYIIKVVTR